MHVIETVISWSHLADASKFWSSFSISANHEFPGNALTTVLPVKNMQVNAIRDWLDEQQMDYILSGIYPSKVESYRSRGALYPFAVRFSFGSFDDKLLFTLRWR